MLAIRASQPAGIRPRGRAAISAFILLFLLFAAATPCLATTHGFRLWPLIDYRSDTAAGERHLQLLGPFFQYDADPSGWSWALRPLLYRRHSNETGANTFAALYPLSVTHENAEEKTVRLLGLFSSQSRTPVRASDWERRVTLFPFVFYRRNQAGGASLSVLPFYADLHDFLGYNRIRLILFPAYLQVESDLVRRAWTPFPFVERTGGVLGRGWRLWPFYGWEQVGESSRMRYSPWPFYVHSERWYTRPEREDTLILAPFYSRIDSLRLHSRAYLGPFFTHTVDLGKQTESWGFPWPLWVSQRRLDTGERQSLRLAPFYGDQRRGDLHSRFFLWPLYRTREQETDTYRYRRRDFFLVLGRDVEEVDTESHRRRELQTLFPLFRRSVEDENAQFSTFALLDALLPSNEIIQNVYAPLWQVYRSDRSPDSSRWSLLWGLLSSDGERLHYPVDWQ